MGDRLRLADLLGGLSIATDLGFGLPPEEAMRSSLIAAALARRIGLAEEEVSDALYTALLGHVGCPALSHETAAIFGDERRVTAAVATVDLADPAEVAGRLVPALLAGVPPTERGRIARYVAEHGAEFGRMYDTGSCEVARATARRLGLGAGVERALHEIGEWWSGGGAPQGLRGDDISVVARVAQVAADAARLDHMAGSEAAVAALRRRAGGVLDPAIVGALAADGARVLAESRAGDPRTRMLEVEPTPHRESPRDDLRAVAAAFGDLADMKTPFTHGHSAAVARLGRAAGERAGLDATTVTGLEVAAHLHDLGRLAVSNAVWEKPGPLTGGEWEQVRMHPYHSERILATSDALAPIARLAGMHHERLDGSGYHRGCEARELSAAARVLAAADVYVAMTHDRPHRPARGGEAAAEALAAEARAGRLDGDAVAGVLDALGDRAARRGRPLRPGGLSEREVEVVRLVAAGCSNPAIAERLVISRRTAEHHVQHVYAKLGVSSRAAVALFAHEHDLLSTVP